ncbi:MAG: DNA polymerase I [Bacteroidales bacterium]|nr:DNA polymerase I [Bacteroidales bacterium]
MKKLFLLDAYALIYRAYFALNKNPRVNSKGLNTSAIMGFLNTLYEVLKNEKPTHIGVAFDLGAPTLRTDDFSAYKANREETPPDIKISVPYIKEIIKGFNIPIFECEGYEADDIIGTISKKAEKEGFTTYMMTPDKDFGQLVSDNIFIYKPAKGGEPAKVLGPKEVCEKYGIARPEQVIDILGLWGDASDNIPGIPGIGEKNASKLIAEYDSVENLINNADKLKGKMRENVTNFAHQGLMSKKLATINTNVPIDFDEDCLKVKEPDFQYLTQLFEELEFRTFMSRLKSSQQDYKTTGLQVQSSEFKVQSQNTNGQLDLFGSAEGDNNSLNLFSSKDNYQTVAHTYHLTNDDEKINELIKLLNDSNIFAFDTETTGLDIYSSSLVGMSFSVKAHEAYYIPLPTNKEECKSMLNKFLPIFSNKEKTIVGHNIKFDLSFLARYDIEIENKLWDTMIAHYLIEPEQNHSMDYLSDVYLNYNPIAIEELIGKGRAQISMHDVPVEKVKEYAAEDADITIQFYDKFYPLIIENQLEKLFHEIEMPLVRVLSKMESNGVKIDIEGLRQISDEQAKEIREIENKIYEIAGTSFNIGSPKQLGEILFEKLNIKAPAKKTKTGQYPTGEEILQKIVNENPIVQNILDYRSLTKLKSTYVDALPSLVNLNDGLIHTSYNQAITATGRLSSNNPNLQNIPVRTEKGREIRKAFVPRDENHILLAADYSQIELRIIAHLSGDAVMQDAFRSGRDIHTDTASRVYNVAIEDVTKEMRRNAKAVNFGIIYGMSAFGLAERLGISRSEASQIIKNYFKEYIGIQEYIDKQVDFAKQHGYVETMLGRRRYLKDINAGNSVVRNFAERNAINAPIQGTSADMIKIAMANIHNEMIDNNLKSQMILQVHDELVFDVHKEELDFLSNIVKDKMINALPLNVPIEVNLNTGTNWLEAH